MSLERRKETKDRKNGKNLEESSFRRTDFTPLIKKEEKEEEKFVKTPTAERLTEIEKDVLEIAKEILKLKRYNAEFEIESESKLQKYPIVEKLYSKCIGKLSYKKGYGKDDIFLAIRNLEKKSWIVTNERRTKLEILNNEKLMQILDFIKKNPGIHARDERIEKVLNITRTPFLKHVMTLERFNLIRSTKIGKTLHYFSRDVHEEFDKFKVIFLNPLIPKILEQLFIDETIAISKLGEMIDIYSGTIQYHIKKLREMNLIKFTKNQSGKKIHVINTELLKRYNEIFKEPDFSTILNGF